MKILGLVENLSGLKCPHCDQMIDIFKTGGGKLTAEKEGLTLLGTLPVEPEVVLKGDAGRMDILDDDALPITRALKEMVDTVIKLSEDGRRRVPIQ